MENKITLFLDSGAYSAWSVGAEIDLDEYAKFVKEHKDLFSYYFNLDVIPGKKDKPTSADDVEKAAAMSRKNWLALKKQGLNSIPIFHQREDFKWLRKMVADKEPYLGISPREGLPADVILSWLDAVFDELTDKDGRPIVKTHGLGVASWRMMSRYPWTTCDATSWALTSAFGQVLIPEYDASGKPDYLAEPRKVLVSNVDRTRKDKTPEEDTFLGVRGTGMQPKHYKTLGKHMQARVNDFLENYVGTSFDKVSSDYEERARAIVFVFRKFEEQLGEVRFKRKRSLISGRS